MANPTPQEIQAKLAEIRAKSMGGSAIPAQTQTSSPTAQQVQAKLAEIRKSGPSPAEPAPTLPAPTTSQAPDDTTTPLGNFFKGLGKSVTGAVAGTSALGERILNSGFKTILPKAGERLLGLEDAPTLGIFKKSSDKPTSADYIQGLVESKTGLNPGDLTEARGTAQSAGKITGDIAQFLLPTGKAGAIGKGLEAAAAAKNFGKAGQLAARVLPSAVKDLAIGEMQEGGENHTQSLINAGVGAGADALFAVGGKVLPKIFAKKTMPIVKSATDLTLPPVPPSGGMSGNATAAVVGDAASKNSDSVARQLLESKTPDARIAKKTISGGNVVKDKIASEAVRQGIPEADVALIKSSSQTDKKKMLEMLDIRQAQSTNKRVTQRATDVVGKTFVENIAKPLEKINREAASKLDSVARKLAGQKIDPLPALNDFAASLDNAGIGIGDGGKLSFQNSNFEGLKPVQSLIRNVWDRANRIAASGDALEAHRLKSYIDEVVNYGKSSEGLSGKAEGILKSLRRGVDTILDQTFPEYNAVNTTFADTITELDKMASAIGRKFKLGDSFADAQAGISMRKIMSNTQSRSEVLRLLDNMQAVAKKYGVEIEDDIISQANFADILENMFGSEAPTSFLGQGERFLNQAEKGVDAASEFGKGNIVKGSIKAGKYIYDVTRGVSAENKIKALRELIGTIIDEGSKGIPFKGVIK